MDDRRVCPHQVGAVLDRRRQRAARLQQHHPDEAVRYAQFLRWNWLALVTISRMRREARCPHRR